MAVIHSAGILAHHDEGTLRVFLGHMGGPFWARKDEAAWSIPKGEFHPATEGAEVAARREFTEETGLSLDQPLVPLGEFRVTSSKLLHAYACRVEHAFDLVASNEFEVEWPPRSGRLQSFPELDRAGWFTLDEARRRLVKGQRPLLDALARRLA